jgi:hypothetical protein
MTGTIQPGTRACVACRREAPPYVRTPGVNLIAICLAVYRRGKGAPVVKGTPSVRICEECLVKALAGSFSHEAYKLQAAIAERLEVRYRAFIEADKA